MTGRRIALTFFVAFLYLLLWIALAVRWVPDLVDEISDDSVLQALLNAAISGSLFLVPFYLLFMTAGLRRPGAPTR